MPVHGVETQHFSPFKSYLHYYNYEYNISGIVKTTSKSSRFIKTCTFVKLRKGSSTNSNSSHNGNNVDCSRGGGGALTNKQTNKNGLLIATSKRASQRKSSGYESSPGGVDSSERDSIDSLKGLDCGEIPVPSSEQKVDNTNTVTVVKTNPKKSLEPLSVLKYEESFIQKLDDRWRSCEVKRLQNQQKELKVDLKEAKNRIERSQNKANWTFNLHVADSVESGLVKSTDPAVIEALQKETEILGKRVDAAKSHAVLTTSFDVDKPEAIRLASPLTSRLLNNCCTTECEPAENMIMENDTNSKNMSSKETEIF